MEALEDAIAIVTGAGTGIGREIALELASCGASIVVGDIRESPGQGDRYGPDLDQPTHRLIEERDGNASFSRTDVGVVEECRSLIDYTLKTYGRIDVLVNNAGIHIEGDLEELEPDEWQRVVDVNLSGTFYCSKFATPFLKESGGSIVNISSVHAIEGGSGPPYASTKAGIVNLTRDLAISLGEYDVTVNAVCPGFIKTPRQDYLTDQELERSREQTVLPRLGDPEDVAKAVVFLVSDNASWITGEALFVDGGWTTHRGV